MDIGRPQAAPAPDPNSAGFGNQGAHRTGTVQPAYTPNINNSQNQPRQQYQPNAYNPAAPTAYGSVAPNPAGMPNGRTGNPSVPDNAVASSGAFTVADQYPAKPPRVSFRNGQLTILAENSTLPDILAAIHQRTGAALELPAALGAERVAAKLGPATTGEVLAELLNGSRFDYIVLNREEDPSSPERIILREKVAANANGSSNGFGNNAQTAGMYQPMPPAQEIPETVPEEVPEEQPQPEAAMPPAGDENQGNTKTPEQLLEELRQLQQQRGQPPVNPQQLLLNPQQQPPTQDNNDPQ